MPFSSNLSPAIDLHSGSLSPKDDNVGFLFGNEDAVARTPLFGITQDSESFDQSYDPPVQAHTIGAIQEALDSILAGTGDETARPRRITLRTASENSTASLESSPTLRSSVDLQSLAPNMSRRSIQSTVDIHHPKARALTGVSADSFTLDAMEDSQTTDDTNAALSASMDSLPDRTFHPSSSAVSLPLIDAKIDLRLAKLRDQENVITALLRSSAAKGSKRELKLLVKSLNTIRREIRTLVAEKDRDLRSSNMEHLHPSNTSITIPGTTIGETEGNKFVLFVSFLAICSGLTAVPSPATL
jgi:sorting nexin-25